jgi:hypothetical protein
LAAPSSGALTGAGYVQVGTTGVYNKTFGTAVVSFNIAQPLSGASLTITPTGDVTAADFTSIVNSLASLGVNVVTQAPYVGMTSPAVGTVPPVNLLAFNGLQSFGMVLS